MADPINSKGILVQIGDDATPTEAWATIGSMLQVTPPDQQADEKDTTTHDTSGNYHRYTLTLINPGQATVQTYSLPEDPIQDHISGLRYRQQHNTRTHFRIVFPTPRQYFQAFYARVKGSAMSTPIDDIMKTTWTQRVDGAVTDGYLA